MAKKKSKAKVEGPFDVLIGFENSEERHEPGDTGVTLDPEEWDIPMLKELGAIVTSEEGSNPTENGGSNGDG